MDPRTTVRDTRGRSVAAEYRRLSALLAAADYLLILASFLLAYLIRFGTSPGRFAFLPVLVFGPPAFVAVFAAFRLYSVQRFSQAEEFRRVFYAVTVGITGIVTASFWTKAQLSRLWIGYSWVLCLVLLMVARRLWHHYTWKARSRGRFSYRTLIVGNNDEAAHLAGVMATVPAGYAPIGYVPIEGGTADMGSLEAVESLDDLGKAVSDTGAECLFVASSALRPHDMALVSKVARLAKGEVRVSANIPEIISTRLSAQPFGGVMAFSVWPVRLTGIQAATKRTFDLVFGMLLLLPSLVLWPAIATAIKVDSRGPVVFRQTRVGRRGRPFAFLKFRTMMIGADAKPSTGPLFKDRDDPRITRAGRVLRRWSLDELPQLFNVVRGDMSLVGPRPSLPAEVEHYEGWQRDRLEVRPGMTGLWQVSGRSDLSFDDYVRLDLFYIENWSVAYDLYLLAKTVPAVLLGKGAF